MAKLFISYRREDSQWQADRLYSELKGHVDDPENDIFIDVDNIPFGVDFVEYLSSKVRACEVLLVLIGPNWLSASNPETGEQRLKDPKDFVHIEIKTALDMGIPVVPVVFDGTQVPHEDLLPAPLKTLSRRNGIPVNRLSFSSDIERLIDGLSLTAASESRPEPTVQTVPLGEPMSFQDRATQILEAARADHIQRVLPNDLNSQIRLAVQQARETEIIALESQFLAKDALQRAEEAARLALVNEKGYGVRKG